MMRMSRTGNKKKFIKFWGNVAETDEKQYDGDGHAAACACHSHDSCKLPIRKIIHR
jgi:hypothetical protein